MIGPHHSARHKPKIEARVRSLAAYGSGTSGEAMDHLIPRAGNLRNGMDVRDLLTANGQTRKESFDA